jgi:DNA-binding MarR family transcriptional regulator
MPTDSVDRILEAWAARDPDLDARVLEVAGRLLLCADYLERSIVASLGPLGLSFRDFDVLNTLRRVGDAQGTHPGYLAQSSLITTGAMTSRLDRLEGAGLITRASSPTDRRAVLVRLTKKGERLAKTALEAVIVADEAFLAPLREQQRDHLAASLKRLLLHIESS